MSYIGSDAQGLIANINGGTIENATLDSTVTFPALGNSAVGTVSESSGTPTGDVIQSGSNSNGYFIKYADGTMICTRTVTGVGPITRSVGSGYLTHSDILCNTSYIYFCTDSHCDITAR